MLRSVMPREVFAFSPRMRSTDARPDKFESAFVTQEPGISSGTVRSLERLRARQTP